MLNVSTVELFTTLKAPSVRGSFVLWCENFCQTRSAWTIEFTCTNTAQLLTFWTVSTSCLLLDVPFLSLGKAHRFRSRKLSTRARIEKCSFDSVFINALDLGIQIILGYLTYWEPMFSVTLPISSPWQMVEEWILAILGREILSYYFQRILHYPYSCARLRKQHEFKIPLDFAAIHSSAVEHVVGNILPLALPMVIMNLIWRPIHVLSFSGYLVCVILIGTAEHNAYDATQPAVLRFHDRYHRRFFINDFSLRFMNWLHGIHGTNAEDLDYPPAIKERLERAKAYKARKGLKDFGNYLE